MHFRSTELPVFGIRFNADEPLGGAKNDGQNVGTTGWEPGLGGDRKPQTEVSLPRVKELASLLSEGKLMSFSSRLDGLLRTSEGTYSRQEYFNHESIKKAVEVLIDRVAEDLKEVRFSSANSLTVRLTRYCDLNEDQILSHQSIVAAKGELARIAFSHLQEGRNIKCNALAKRVVGFGLWPSEETFFDSMRESLS